MKETLLELRDVHVQYGGVKALDGLSVSIDEGEIIALIGPNGAGKSTVLKAIFGLAPIKSGGVFWHEKEIIPVPHEIVGRGIAFVPQGRQLFMSLSVEENIEMGGYIIKDKSLLKENMKIVLDLFPALKKKIKEPAGSLSGGQQQMVALARGLMTDPKVLLLDEPSLGLAPKIVKEVFEKIKEIKEKRNTAIFIVEHNIKSVMAIADSVYLLAKGKVILQGTTEEVLQSTMLEKIFTGKM